MNEIQNELRWAVEQCRAVSERLERLLGGETTPVQREIWDRDIRSELARNERCPSPLAQGWWRRELGQINGLTVHHTLSHSPHATAENYIHKEGGRPSIPYHLWIAETGEILYCLDLTEGCWHDHTGHENRHISLGLAGSLHLRRPPNAQLEAAVRVARWAIEHPAMAITLDGVRGHRDYAATVCPGWTATGWREDFYARLTAGTG
jgi:hypothetical protein